MKGSSDEFRSWSGPYGIGKHGGQNTMVFVRPLRHELFGGEVPDQAKVIDYSNGTIWFAQVMREKLKMQGTKKQKKRKMRMGATVLLVARIPMAASAMARMKGKNRGRNQPRSHCIGEA